MGYNSYFFISCFNLFQDKNTQTKNIALPYSEFLSQVKLNNINDVTIKENNINGEVLSFNKKLEDDPELINTDPYGEGWIIKIDKFQDVT